tara:strand:+ start:3741 stop:4121 length:381 start_codon:yes stop_codon:yes gene_type:complete
MTLHIKLTELFEKEVSERVSTLLGEYAETISKKHAVPLDMLLRDLPVVSAISLCKGTKSNGQRCLFRANDGGYCRHHVIQGNNIKLRSLSSSNLHTHGPEKMYVRGCPGCENSKELIDLGSILSNE